MSNATKQKPAAHLPRKIKVEHAKCIAAGQEALRHAINCGKYLTEAKANVPHGEWIEWVKANCQFSKKTDEVYRALFRAKEELLKESKRATNFSIRGAVSWLKKRRAEANATGQELDPRAGVNPKQQPDENVETAQETTGKNTPSPTPTVASKLTKLMKECHLKGKLEGLLHLLDLLGVKREAVEKKLAALS
jgi:hypothetical protein